MLRRSHTARCPFEQSKSDDNRGDQRAHDFGHRRALLSRLWIWREIGLRMARSRVSSGTVAGGSAVVGRSRAPPLHSAKPDLDVRHPECGAAFPAGGLEAHAGFLPVVRDERGVLTEPIGSELLE